MSTASGIRQFRHLFIGGEWVKPKSREWITTVDPSTEQIWARFPNGNAGDVDRAVSAAKRALQGAWRTEVTPSKRGKLIQTLAGAMSRNAEELARLESRDNGKPIRETLSEIHRAVQWLEYYAGLADKIEGAYIPIGHGSVAYTVPEPVGVVGAIIPWNSPLMLMCWKLGPALAAGNTLVIKPAELTSASALAFAEIVAEVGLPSGVINIVTGDGPGTGAALVQHPDVSKISFTGEHTTAQSIMIDASHELKRCSFECGGKSGHLIFEDADLERVIPGAIHSAFRSTGQSCSLTSRLIVHDRIYEQVVETISARSARVCVGMPLDPNTHIGPQTSRQQLDKTMSFIAAAVEDGSTLVFGGERPPAFESGYFVQPTVFADVDPGTDLARKEVFGPVLAVMRFSDEMEGIRIVNDTKYGLVSGLWTSDVARAHRVANELEVGTVAINTFRPIHWAVPYGGTKLSGIGRENGMHSIQEFIEQKSIVMDLHQDPVKDPFGIGA